VADIADLVLLCAPPGAGDTIQHMKAGVLEVPDVVAVTKSDLGAPARRTRAELKAALSLGSRAAPVVACSAATGDGIAALAREIDAAAAGLAPPADRHATQAQRWAEQQIAGRFGSEGLGRLRERFEKMSYNEPFTAVQEFQLRLSVAFGNAFG
jgi:LAO/AO transport system kinase